MKFPKLKYPRLCRILTYVVVIGCGLLPIVVVLSVPAPDLVRVAVILGALVGLLVYLVRNFMVLMMMDMELASLSCYRTARKQYKLPANRTADTIYRSILRYGTQCDPSPIQPQPSALRYKFSNPLTVYSRGIERVIAAYEVDLLDKDIYQDIFSSAKTNSKALTGRKKAIFLDKQQKKQPLHRVTVLIILAHRIDPRITPNLYELVCQQCGDENEDCIVPCVVDLANHTCVFNCLRVPYIGFGYAVKNRGIRIVRNKVFGGNLNFKGNQHFLEPIRDINPEDSLWEFWGGLRHQFVDAERKTNQRFASMSEREIYSEENILYLKWDHRGIGQMIQLDREKMAVKVESITDWYYPKIQPAGKKTIQKMEEQIVSYYRNQGYTVEFVDAETMISEKA